MNEYEQDYSKINSENFTQKRFNAISFTFYSTCSY